MKKYPDIVPEEAPLIILDSKSAVCMDNNGKNTKHTRHIYGRVNCVRSGEKLKCKRFTGVKGVYNWHTLKLIMLIKMT